MRTYEVTLEIKEYRKVTVTSEERLNLADAQAAAIIQEDLSAMNTRAIFLSDLTPKQPTDKDRFNDAFRALRKMGYAAKQNQSRYAPEYPVRHVMTMADDVDAFRHGRLVGMVPIHWDSDNIEDTREIRDVFMSRGFDVEWSGTFYDCFEIRKGVEA